MNGKAGPEFVVYLVGTQVEDLARFGSEVTLEIENTIYPDAPMFLSTLAQANGAWAITENSAEAVLGDVVKDESAAELPQAWKQDAALRELRLKLVRQAAKDEE